MLKKVIIYIALLLVFNTLSAQYSSLKCISVSAKDTIFLDSNTVIQSSISTNPKVDFTFFNNKIILSKSGIDSIKICFKTLPYNIHSQKFNKSTDRIDSLGGIFKYGKNYEQKEEIFSTPGIEKTGVISRGISFGNNQDVFVNSNLNLQMQGKISEDVELIATISDQNVPIQPDGNTQQLQEFDKIYLQIKNPKWDINAGDILLKNTPQSYFMKYDKQVQGGQFNLKFKGDSNHYSKSSVAVSLAKGKFFSQNIQAIEGVQGPYRLTGSNGESFIIIIANSEKVFLDGQPLIRGFNYDYTIDYNSAEIIFNNTITITKFSRIRVDFEYTERTFTRSVMSVGHEQKLNNKGFYYEFFSEKDNPRQPIIMQLKNSDYERLSQIGDNINQAYVSGVTFLDTTQNEGIPPILYKQVIDGTDTIYVYSTHPDSAKYKVIFSEVGEGFGSYALSGTPVNGRIFRYVGQGNGKYLPVKIIPAPNKREMMTFGGTWDINKNVDFFSEFTLSNNDLNLVSDFGNEDNKGIGIRNGIRMKNKSISDSYKLSYHLEHQLTSVNFKPLDRIRDVDFERNWSANTSAAANDNILFSKVRAETKDNQFYEFDFNYRNRFEDMEGFQNNVNLKKEIGILKIESGSFVMNSSRESGTAQWRRVLLHPSINLGKIAPGYKLFSEKNREANASDSVFLTQMNFEEHNFYIKNGDSSDVKFNLNYQKRFDYKPQNGELYWFYGINNNRWSDNANTYTASLSKEISSDHKFALTGTYRELQTKLQNDSMAYESNLLSRVDVVSNAFKRHLKSELTYTVNTGREIRREFQYIRWENYTTATHVWRDNNRNGIEDLDEFFPIINNETDSTYVKYFIPTNDYIIAFTNNLNYRFNVKAPSGWRGKSGIKNIISRFDNLSVLNIDRKTTNRNFNERLNPFLGLFDTVNLQNSDVLGYQKSHRSTLFFNRANPTFGFDVTKINVANKQLLNNGTDSREVDDWMLNLRINISKYVSNNTSFTYGNRLTKSTYLPTRNYAINEINAKPEIAFQPNSNLRYVVKYGYVIKKGNTLNDTQAATFNQAGLEMRLNQLSNRTISAEFFYKRIIYTGEVNTPIAYEMLEAFNPGNNYIWTLNMQQRLSNGLNINLIYEGRKPESRNAIHTGRMQVSALF